MRFDLVTRSFRNRHKISHNTKGKIWRQLWDVIFPTKNVKIGKIKIMKFYGMTSFTLLRKFSVIALKLYKLFEIWISHDFLTKKILRGITVGIGPIWGSGSLTLCPLFLFRLVWSRSSVAFFFLFYSFDSVDFQPKLSDFLHVKSRWVT